MRRLFHDARRARVSGIRVRATIAVIVAAGCRTLSPNTATSTPISEITIAEVDHIDDAAATTAYDIVRLLRPWMLVSRSLRDLDPTAGARHQSPQHDVEVYLDGAYVGGVDGLKSIPRASVARVRWLSPIEAAACYGPGHTGSAIAVSSARNVTSTRVPSRARAC